jgi:hypothetical protein
MGYLQLRWSDVVTTVFLGVVSQTRYTVRFAKNVLFSGVYVFLSSFFLPLYKILASYVRGGKPKVLPSGLVMMWMDDENCAT